MFISKIYDPDVATDEFLVLSAETTSCEIERK
jgi:hypothetical protein